MNPFSRLVGYTVLLLAIYVAIVLGIRGWVGSETRRLEVLAQQQRSGDPTAAAQIDRASQLQRRLMIGLVVGGAVLMFALIALAASTLKSAERTSRTPWLAARVEMAGMTELARTSVAQSEALDRERSGRQRAEQDSAMKEQQLARSLEEKLRLGRDLHDGLIQSLYAAGLTLESVRALVRENPAEADRQLEQCLGVLNATIADVRAFITGLKPEQLRSAGFSAALDAIVRDLRAGRDVVFDLRVDEDASGMLSPEQQSEALQIVREAVSNCLRHGGANRVTIRLHRTDHEICLLVQDNGGGFDVARRSSGHGLGNMRTRAGQVGATLKIESQPGEGSRVIVTLPRIQPA